MVKGLRKSLILSCVLALFLPSVASADMNVSRIAGANRYETAMKVQQKYQVQNRNEVVISSGHDFRTALYASYMANVLRIPFYVIPNTGLSRVMLNEFSKSNTKKVYIIGNYNNLNRSIDNSIKSLGIQTKRISDTYVKPGEVTHIYPISDKIEEELSNRLPLNPDSGLILVNEDKFPDLISSIPLISQYRKNFGSSINDLRYLGHSLEDPQIIIGGPSSVPYINNSYVERISGQNRYKTAVEIAKKCVFLGNTSITEERENGSSHEIVFNKIDTVVLVDGTNYPDALASGTVATMNNGAILLTKPGKLNEDTKAFIQENNIQNVIIVGGEKSVSKNVENELRGL